MGRNSKYGMVRFCYCVFFVLSLYVAARWDMTVMSTLLVVHAIKYKPVFGIFVPTVGSLEG
jgi:hypothetical protein